MKIGIFQPYLNIYGGAERQVLEFANSLARLNNEVEVFTFLHSKDIYKNLGQNIKINELPLPLKNVEFIRKTVFTYTTFLPVYIKYQRFEKTIKYLEKDFDVLNPHTFPITWVTDKANVPKVWMSNEVPERYVYHNNPIFNLIKAVPRKIILEENKEIVRRINKIVVLDERTREDMQKVHNRKDVELNRPSVNTHLFKELNNQEKTRIKERLGIDNEKVILFVSRLEPGKRVIDFLEACKHTKAHYKKDVVPIVVGGGPEEVEIPKYKSYFKKLIHLKNIDDKVLMEMYNIADVLIFPPVNQPWGLVPFEAMSCGTPVVVSTDAGASEVLNHKKTAILVEPRKPTEIAKWINYLLGNETFRGKLGENGRNFVNKNISWEVYTKRMLRIFESAVKEGPIF